MKPRTETINLRDALGRKLPGGAVIYTVSSEGGPHVKARLHCPDGLVEVEWTEEAEIAADPWQATQLGDDGPPIPTDPMSWRWRIDSATRATARLTSRTPIIS